MQIRFVLHVVVVWALAVAALARGPEEGKSAPPLRAKLLDGTTFSLGAQMGKVVLVNFWATWCGPCRAEMPALDAYFRKHKSEGIELLAVSMDEPKDEAKVREAMRPFAFSGALSRDTDAGGYGRIWRIPLTFVIDRSGVLRRESWYAKPGIDEDLLEKTITPLLSTP
ncbi:MAG TPA: TlpA disulfide reductase family protein [Steroidobacteraceae bacterium]|nr:TlpA disulfide reductase family protein [Steroidobacteraceae bacterium]